ncbi:MAG: hypothetical protein IJY25_04955 [Bacilli bacterium]|nr:hypothetical protein [Bacilli bacterium]
MIENENQIDYQTLKTITEHAKQYDIISDKKTFLKNVSLYEQKIILLTSQDPYEVLSYLEEIDLKNLRIILNQLKYEEIKNILDKFTSEDKQRFYTTFSDLELVNQFILQDKNSDEYISDLTFNRKVEILNSSKAETQLASSKVYESMTVEEKDKVEDKLTDVDGISALNNVVTYDDHEINESIENSNKGDVVEEKVETNEETKEKAEQSKEENQEDKEILEDRSKYEFLLSRIEYYKNSIEKFKEIDLLSIDKYSLLPVEIQNIVDNDYNRYIEKIKNNDLKNDSNELKGNTAEMFVQVAQETEKQEIAMMIQQTEDIKLEETLIK